MITNCNGRAVPNSPDGPLVMPKFPSKGGPGEDVETHWSEHIICMEGETTLDDIFENDIHEPHIQWAHLIN